jgi:hypothetical protein
MHLSLKGMFCTRIQEQMSDSSIFQVLAKSIKMVNYLNQQLYFPT